MKYKTVIKEIKKFSKDDIKGDNASFTIKNSSPRLNDDKKGFRIYFGDYNFLGLYEYEGVIFYDVESYYFHYSKIVKTQKIARKIYNKVMKQLEK